jgi:hypothetical protein
MTLRSLIRHWFVLAAVVALAAVAVIGAPSALGAALPYSDSTAVGGIAFCDPSGKPMTHGSINDRPFAWRAIGQKRGPAAYDVEGRTATMFAYQPRKDVLPGQWSGQALTASARFQPAGNPIAASTPADGSLADFMGTYPLTWDNLIEVRIYIGAPGIPQYSRTYNAANIKVSGTTWTVVNPTNVSCSIGTSISIETILLPSVRAMPTPTPGVTPSSSASTASGSAPAATDSAGNQAVVNGSTSSSPRSTLSAASHVSGSSRWIWGGLGAVLAVAAAGSFVWWRRRPGATS